MSYSILHPPISFSTLPPTFFCHELACYLQRVDARLIDEAAQINQTERTLVIFGGCAVCLWLAHAGCAGDRVSTRDLDVYGTHALCSSSTLRAHFQHRETLGRSPFEEVQFTGDQFCCPPDEAKNRIDITHIFGLSQLRVFVLHPFDLMITKIARYGDRDYQDLDALYEGIVCARGHEQKFIDYFYTAYAFVSAHSEQLNYRDASLDLFGQPFDESLVNMDPRNI